MGVLLCREAAVSVDYNSLFSIGFPPLTTTRAPVQTTTIPVRWGDMDAQGHVNNTVYFRYMEQARIEWLERVGQRVGQGPGMGSVIVNASCTFIEPIEYPGTVEVRMFIGSPGRSSFETQYELWAGTRKHAEGAAKIVWIDRSTQRSTPLPDALRALFR
jgi:acyl-CoA thioester hydrolase